MPQATFRFPRVHSQEQVRVTSDSGGTTLVARLRADLRGQLQNLVGPDGVTTLYMQSEAGTTTVTGTVPGDGAATTQAAVDTAVAALVTGAPAALDTLDELAAALGDDANYAATVTTALAARLTTVSHGSTAGTTRPTSVLPVLWIGTVAPTNRATRDLWMDETAITLKRWDGSAWVASGGSSLARASNLSDLADAAAARTNLGLGTAATQPSSAYLTVGVTNVDVDGKYGGDLVAAMTAEGQGKRYLLRSPLYQPSATLALGNGTALEGVGRSSTVIKLPNGGNRDLVQTTSFGTLTGTSTTSAPKQFALRRLTLDGNRANNASGWVLRCYGSDYDVDGVVFQNGHDGGVWSEWGNSGTNMEARWRNFRIYNNDGTQFDWNGPHDSHFLNGVVDLDGNGPASVPYGLRVRGNSGGEQFTNMHVWGSHVTGWSAEAAHRAYNCVSEGATGTNLLLLANKVIWHGEIFGTNGANPTEVGVQIGDASHTCKGYLIDIMTWNWGAGSTPIKYYSTSADQGGTLRATATLGGASAVRNGNPNTASHCEILTVDAPTGSTNWMPAGIRVKNRQTFAVEVTDAVSRFRVNTGSGVGTTELVNGTTLIGYSDEYATTTFKVDPADGSVRSGTSTGLGGKHFSGAGDPNGAVTGTAGDRYSRVTSALDQVEYVCSGGTAWVKTQAMPAVTPTDQGLCGWSLDPAVCASSNVLTSGTIYYLRVRAADTRSVTSLIVDVFTAGSGLTAGQNLLALYDSSGNQLAVSADQTTAWGTTGIKSAAITSTPVTAGSIYYIGVLSVGTTPPFLARGQGTSGLANAGIASAPFRFNTGATGQTALPATVTLTGLAAQTSSWFAAIA